MSNTNAVLEDILSTLDVDHDVSEIRTCVYWTAVNSLRYGLASPLSASLLPSKGHQVEKAGNLLPTGAKALARLSLSARILEASIGLAAINSVLPVDESLLLDLNAGAEICTRGAGKRTAIIGHFPFVEDLRKKAKELWVFELPGRGHPGDFTGHEMETLLPQADVVGISSTTLINHTLGRILDHIAPGAYKVMIGPSAPLSSVLLDCGFDVIFGSIVVDCDQVLTCISQGANFRQIRGVRKVAIRRHGS